MISDVPTLVEAAWTSFINISGNEKGNFLANAVSSGAKDAVR